MKLAGWLADSSANPGEVALTVRGALVSFVPFLVLILKFYGVEFDSDSFINAVVNVVTAVFGAVGAVMTLYGFVRKVVLQIKK